MRAFAVAAALAGPALLLAGCGGGGKAGGSSGKRTIVLTFASQIGGGQPEQLQRFVSEVERRSGGTIRIDFKDNWRAGDLRQEANTIVDVKAGKVDLAWVGARAWDWVGVSSFEPLIAPLLIDTYALEREVFGQRIPQQMLAGVERAGVVGIGVLPGPLRRVVGVRRPLLAPADFTGIQFGVQGLVAAATLRALGARPRQFFAQAPLDDLDGIEEQVGAFVGNEHYTVARYVMANVNLWPRPLVIFAGRKVFRTLDEKQRAALRDAATGAVPQAMLASEQEDVGAMPPLCASHEAALVTATRAQLRTLREAVEPVYRRIERDPRTRAMLRRIETLARRAPPAARLRCGGRATGTGAAVTSPLDGTWEMHVDRSDLVGNPAYEEFAAYKGQSFLRPTEEDYRLDAGTLRYVIHDGHFTFTGRGGAGTARDAGTLEVDGDLVVFHITVGHDLGETWTYRWSSFRDTLTFSAPPPGHSIGPPNPMFAVWHRVGK